MQGKETCRVPGGPDPANVYAQHCMQVNNSFDPSEAIHIYNPFKVNYLHGKDWHLNIELCG